MECTLKTGDLLRLSGGARGTELTCLAGTLWLTQGDGVDYLVAAGHAFRLAAGASAIVEGLGRAEFRLVDLDRVGRLNQPARLTACRAS